MQINNVPTPLLPDTRPARPDGAATNGASRPATPALRQPAARPVPVEPAFVRSAPAAVPVDRPAAEVTAPAGTDPKLWSILTSEEKSYFAKNSAQGPLTYARVMLGTRDAGMAPAMRGLRVDIRG
ncbi:MAG: hypothetical protein HY275_18560 [Gemmatimonadetes bacterium]|nr:hypothetical protein [Gemmatimonadota bacterium]